MNRYSISDLEKLTGVKAHTLRIWEKRYGVCHPCRDNNNVRQYGEEDLQHLIKVSHLNNLGYKISSIACLCSKELDNLYRQSIQPGGNGCCIMDKLTLAVEQTQESKLYIMLKDRLEQLGLKVFATKIWEPMQERLGFLILSNTLHSVHRHFFDQTVERLIEAHHVKAMMSNDRCIGSALLINTCGTSSTMFHQLVKHSLIKRQLDTVSLSLCQSNWKSLEYILANRKFDFVMVHYQATEFDHSPPYKEVDQWISDETQIILYGTEDLDETLPIRWKQMPIDELVTYIESDKLYNIQVETI